MMLFGMISIFLGVLILWKASVLIGLLLLVSGFGLVAREYLTPQPEARAAYRDYSSQVTSYDISSKPRR